MRQILAIILLATCSLAHAQLEFAPIGAEWFYSVGLNDNPYAGYHHYVSTKDTLVNGKTARVITSNRDTIITHEDNGRVYYLFNDKFRLIYDFSAKVGDTLVFEFMAPKPESYIYDTTYYVAFEVERISNFDEEGGGIRMFSTVVVEVDSLDYEPFKFLVWDTKYTYFERIGYYYNGLITKIKLPCVGVSSDHLRCYKDADLNYISEYWKNEGKPCDYKSPNSIMEVRSPFELNTYPNPVYNTITIETKGFSGLGLRTVKIFNQTGVPVLSQRFDASNPTIDVSHLPPGLYLISFFDNNGLYSNPKKIIKI